MTEEQIDNRKKRINKRRRELYASSPEYRAKSAERDRARYLTPEYRQAQARRERERYASNPAYRLHRGQYETLRYARLSLERAIKTAEELYA